MIDLYITLKGRRTIEERVDQYRDAAHKRMSGDFAKAGVEYPPKKVSLVGIKEQRIIQVWAVGADGHWKHAKDYPVLGMSGGLGPKLLEGDGQVPEGLYKIEYLNPNSVSHVSLKIGYPNAEDVRCAKLDGRTNLGGDIMIHGGKSSGGCLAVGNPASEDLFVLAAETGVTNVSVILTPVDFRSNPNPANIPVSHSWIPALYDSIKAEQLSLK